MFDLLHNFIAWLSDIGRSVITFFESVVKGLSTMISSFPRIMSVTSNAIGYLPSIFAVFITITIIVSIVYIIVGRNTGGSD